MPPDQRIAQLQAIADEIISLVEQTLASGEELPEDILGAVAEIISDITNQIEQARQGGGQQEEREIEGPEELEVEPTFRVFQRGPQGGVRITPQPIPPLEPAPHESSNVNSFKFDPRNKELYVKFHGKDSKNSGSVYKYSNVEPYIFDIIRRGAIAPKTTGRNKYHAWYKGRSPSHGASVNAVLKAGGFQYKRLS